MKTATVRHLRNHYSAVLRWIDAGEEVSISPRGKIVTRLVPESDGRRPRVDWSASSALGMDKSLLPRLSAKASAALLAESQGEH